MKVGLITIYQVPNYGSVLQTYATQTIIEKLGYSCSVINYKYPNELQNGNSVNFRAMLYRFLTNFGLSAQQRKILELKKFIRENFHLTRRYNSFEELKVENWSSYDVMAVGSDQVWHTEYTRSEPAFLLKFLPDDKKRISIASSFASKNLDMQYIESFKTELSKFSHISVREANGLKILENLHLGKKNPVVCLDPTLLLSKEEWGQISRPYDGSQRYILLYMWTYAFDPQPYIYNVVRHFRKMYGNCKVIALEGYCNISVNIRKELDIICAEDSSVPEFIYLFANADLVITSSFHGTAFAVNMGVPLVSIVPDNNGDDRQSSFLRSVEASNCIVEIGQDLNTINPYYNREDTTSQLNVLRKKSIEILNAMIQE